MIRPRIMITGTRHFKNRDAVARLLRCFDPQIDVIVGDCPTGVDFVVRSVCAELGLHCLAYEADFRKHGDAAGPIRNKQMVQTGPDLCLAFFGRTDRNKGTTNAYQQAVAAGIPALEIWE